MLSKPVLNWVNDHLLDFGSVQVELRVDEGLHSVESTPQRFLAGKTRGMVEILLDTLGPTWPRRIVELGIHKGGSVVLYDQVFQPQRFLAVDIAAQAPPALADYARARPQLKLACATDQGDGAALDRACRDAFGDAPLDLVIDDASHLLGLTQASFQHLFPRLAPGGLYVIEDWAWAHWPGDAWQKGYEPYFKGRKPLSNLILKLMLLTASFPDAVADIRINVNQVFVRRGPARLQPGFDLDACVLNRGEGLPSFGEGEP